MVPRLTPAVKYIIIVTTAIYIVSLMPGAHDFLFSYCVLVPAQVKSGWVWQLFTYMLLHNPVSPWHLVFNMLTLYFFGGDVESAWGSKRFVFFYLLCGFGAGLCALLFDPMSQVLGASGAVFGVLVAFAMLFPDAVVLFFGVIPMRAPHIVLLFIAVEVVMLLSATSGISAMAHLGGAATGWLYMKYSWRLGNWFKQRRAAPRRDFGGPTPITSKRGSRSAPRSSRPAPGGATVTPMPSRPAVSAEELAIQKQADEILDKISRDGMGSLSREEREILHKHSQILKAREGDVVRLDDYRS
jgi:membrane associated rhomboid family serine protease